VNFEYFTDDELDRYIWEDKIPDAIKFSQNAAQLGKRHGKLVNYAYAVIGVVWIILIIVYGAKNHHKQNTVTVEKIMNQAYNDQQAIQITLD